MIFNPLIPELVVSNLKKSEHFYITVLGFTKEYSRKRFTFLSLQGSQIMISESHSWMVGELEAPYGRGINFQIQVKDLKPLLSSLKKQKYPLFREVKESWYKVKEQTLGNKEFLIQDPDGYLRRFFEDLGRKP